MKPGRNEPCPCRSGKKFKKCCGTRGVSPPPAPTLISAPKAPVEPHLNLVPSVPYRDRRARAVLSSIYMRPGTETFHEFLVNIVLWTFGEQWWKSQVGMREEDRHVVVRWKYDFAAGAKRAVAAGITVPGTSVYTAVPTGPSWALISLGYDLFCLQAVNRLPDFVVDRLRKDKYFQGARYEIAAAAVIARAGFEIEFAPPPRHEGEKVCEFFATHRATGARLAVEAKSRRRPGALNDAGTFQPAEDATWIYRRIREAKKQRPPGTPFLIFVDVNFPLSPETPPDDRPWAKGLKAALEKLGKPSPSSPDFFNAIVVTNFAHYYDPTERLDRRGEWGIIPAPYPDAPLPDPVLNSVIESLDRYDRVPQEI